MYMRLMKMTTTIPESIEIILTIIDLQLVTMSIAIIVVVEIILSFSQTPTKAVRVPGPYLLNNQNYIVQRKREKLLRFFLPLFRERKM